MNDPAKEKQARERYVEVYAEQQFKTNLSQQINIRSIELSNLPFYGSFTWHLRKNINVLLGKNGYGKSHLMSLLLAQLQEEERKLREL
jgi:putative ribosome biogenesis GTPase RsgA